MNFYYKSRIPEKINPFFPYQLPAVQQAMIKRVGHSPDLIRELAASEREK